MGDFVILACSGPHALPLDCMADELVVTGGAAPVFAVEFTVSSGQRIVVLILSTSGAHTLGIILTYDGQTDVTSNAVNERL